jgi:oxygen-independent coproporphyrinogen III oxidase
MPVLRELQAPAGTPLYVHLPFCAAKCHYCDFFSVPAEGQDLAGMVEAILSEARERAPRAPSTVFLGGGTPSLLPEELLRRLLEGLADLTGFRESAGEVTAECNPESLDRAKARLLLDLGVTRISIGFQSLRPDVLELFGRVHGVEDAFRAFEGARSAGARSINVDLIYAVPGQSLEQWEQDLARVLSLGPDHVAAYNLAFEEETLFKRWLDQGRLTPLPEEVELEFFEATRGLLAASGLEPYEVSNFARAGEQCLHNINYWDNGPYLGLGPSAVSSVGGRRWGNVRSVAGYRSRIRSGSADGAQDWSEQLAPLERLGETWWLGLRTARGVHPGRARATAGLSALDEARDPAFRTAQRLLTQGLLELEQGGHYRLTARGWPLADAVSREFIGLAAVPAHPAEGLELQKAAAPRGSTGTPR